ncbi:hypothetical protein OUZ56_003519 [Daphnia magna]|uniref:Uncharacterized protein n=1 Tax=Daphnia magna TaxID=35525 RepID=A0ABR0A990_9CRUS|nr:hypothetical protein OUZ56_003519 [Daphnia magna]
MEKVSTVINNLLCLIRREHENNLTLQSELGLSVKPDWPPILDCRIHSEPNPNAQAKPESEPRMDVG